MRLGGSNLDLGGVGGGWSGCLICGPHALEGLESRKPRATASVVDVDGWLDYCRKSVIAERLPVVFVLLAFEIVDKVCGHGCLALERFLWDVWEEEYGRFVSPLTKFVCSAFDR